MPASLDLSSLREPLQADDAAAKDRVKHAAAAGWRRWRDQLTPEQRRAYLRLLSRRNREVWLGRSKGEIARIIAPLHEGMRRWRTRLTARELAAFLAPLQEGARCWWASLTPEERSEWRREQLWQWFPQLDLEGQRKVLAAISHSKRSERRSTSGPADGGRR